MYLEHKWKPLKEFHFNSLKNKYAYCCHDDDYIVTLYMKSLEDYKSVIKHKILSELKGRKRSIEAIPNDIIDELYNIFKDGAVFDLENSYDNGVRILTVGEITGVDNIHSKLDKQRKIPGAGVVLDYNPKSKKWKLYK